MNETTLITLLLMLVTVGTAGILIQVTRILDFFEDWKRDNKNIK